MDKTHLGQLEVPLQGLGCMGMSEFYGPADWDESIATIQHALDLGVTLIDTADIYGQGHNEVLVGRAIHDRRDEVQLATKFAIDRSGGDSGRKTRGAYNYVKRSCEASLLRLGVDVIDLYYIHRPPQDVEIEETVGAMAELVQEGKVRFLGVSEFDGDLIRRAHAVHPIAALQSEYSLWQRDVEQVAPVLSELGIGLVAYSPLGRGFLTGALDRQALTDNDFRRRHPRFVGEAGDLNEAIADTVVEVAKDLDVEASQVALAWIYHQAERLGTPIVTIPGTKRIKWLNQNVGAVDVELPPSALERLDPLAAQAQGTRRVWR
jgi:aryl-alcohol dehydrogenase-like predicted oxidoreductase